MSSERSARTIGWYRTSVDRETMRALNQRSDFKGLLQAGAHMALIALTGMLAWRVQDQWYLLLPTLLAYGTFYIFLLNATHELCHNTVFKTRLLNDFFLRLFCFLGWRSHIMFWTSHAEHHKYTLHPPDDLEVVLPAKMGLKHLLQLGFVDPWTMYATIKTHIEHSLGIIKGEWPNHLFPPEEVQKRRRLFWWARFLLVGHAAIIGFSGYYGLWLLPVLTTCGVFYGGWLRFLCNNTQHAGLQDDVADFRLCTRTVILNPFFRFLYWHMNFHIEHHMYAAVPCYNLGKLHEHIKGESPVPPRGLYAAWKGIIAIMKAQRTDPSYQYVPELPAHAAV
jgi:fatty acid desaturase